MLNRPFTLEFRHLKSMDVFSCLFVCFLHNANCSQVLLVILFQEGILCASRLLF